MDKIGKSLEENQQDLEFTKEFQNMTLEEMQDAVADYASRVESEAERVEAAYQRMAEAYAAMAALGSGSGGRGGGGGSSSSGGNNNKPSSKPTYGNGLIGPPESGSLVTKPPSYGNGLIGPPTSGSLVTKPPSTTKPNPNTGRAGGIEMGAVDFTGPLMVHGTPENPEYVLTSRQMENLVKNMSRTIPEGRLNRESKSEDVVFTNCKFELPNVREPNNFIPSLKQLAKQNRK